MLRTLYAFTVIALVGSTAWTATGIKSARPQHTNQVGIVLLAALQR